MQHVVPKVNSAGSFDPIMKLSLLYTDWELLKSRLVPNESKPNDDSNIDLIPDPVSYEFNKIFLILSRENQYL